MGRGGDSTLELKALTRSASSLPATFRLIVKPATPTRSARVTCFDAATRIGVLSVKSDLQIETIEVLPEYQRRGVATAMMDAFEDATGQRPLHSWEGLTAAGEAWARKDDPEGWDAFRSQFPDEVRCPNCTSLALQTQPDGSHLCGGCGNWLHGLANTV